MIDVSDLQLVEAICETGSITRAAQTLHVSQPTLSKRLARLEQQLNTKLFLRAPTGLKPTLVASYLVRRTGEIKANIASVERQVERLIQHDTGDLKVGVGPIIEQVLLPPVLVDFAKQTGNVRLSIVTDRAEALFDQLTSGELDVIAGPYDHDNPNFAEAGIHAVPLIREQSINVARKGHPIFDKNNRKDFLDYPYAAPPRQGVMALGPRFSLERPRVIADNYTLLKQLVLQTDYICGGPRHIFRHELEAATMLEIPDSPTLEWRSACLMKAESLETPLVDLFVALMTKHRTLYQQTS